MVKRVTLRKGCGSWRRILMRERDKRENGRKGNKVDKWKIIREYAHMYRLK